jgi:pyrroloquinoline quinone (PQQ) biosynthesis protein C
MKVRLKNSIAMNKHIETILTAIEPLRNEIINHPVYEAIRDIDDLKIFMKYHVYAVWDFMSLLKTLQNKLTCTTAPWFPIGSADTRFLINEIVVGEESDEDLNGNKISHFELYLNAMKQCGADTSSIELFIETLKATGDFHLSFAKSNTPKAAVEFVDFTFRMIKSGKAHLQSAIFTFGREDLIPGMFVSIINEIHKNFPEDIAIFKYYIERHIEVDGEHHSHLAIQMTSNLCGDNEAYWEEAQEAVIQALKQRKELWDGVLNEITIKRKKEAASEVFVLDVG